MNDIKFLDDIHKRNFDFLNSLDESSPEIGIIYVVNGKIHIESAQYNQLDYLTTDERGRTYTYKYPHALMWKRNMLKIYPEESTDWMYHPRARIVYEIPIGGAAGNFILYADRCIINNKTMVNEIMKLMKLPLNAQVINTSHYQCAKCCNTS